MESDDVGEYSKITIEEYRRQLFGSDRHNHGFVKWLRDRGTPVSQFFYNQGYAENSGGDRSLGALASETWTQFLVDISNQPALASVQCCAIISLLKFMQHRVRNSDCNTPEFLTSRSNYDNRLKIVIKKFSAKFTKINKTLNARRKTNQTKEARFNPNKLEQLKSSYNELFIGPYEELRATLKRMADEVLEDKTISPVAFKKASDTLAYLVAVDDGNRPQVYEEASRADWLSYQQHASGDQGSFTSGSLKPVALKTSTSAEVSVCNRVANLIDGYINIRDQFLHERGIPTDLKNAVNGNLPLFVRSVKTIDDKPTALPVQFKNIRNGQNTLKRAVCVREYR